MCCTTWLCTQREHVVELDQRVTQLRCVRQRGVRRRSIRHLVLFIVLFFSSRRRHTRFKCDWSSDVSLPICRGPARGGLVATFVQQASLVPRLPRFVVGIANQHHTGELIRRSRAFALHLLSEDELDWVPRFGLTSGRSGGDKFAGLRTAEGATGSPILEDA